METYLCLMLVIGPSLAFIPSARCAYLISYRNWDLDNTQSFIIALALGTLAAALTGMLISSLAEYGGFLFALAGTILAMPLVGLVWVLVVGFNKALVNRFGKELD